jgi:hypothetical protein
MDSLAPHLPELALAGALAWGAGIRLYLVVFALGLAGWNGWMELPPSLEVLATPTVIGAAGFMTLVELFADKVFWLDSLWDVAQTLIRIPAGAALAAGVFGDSGSAAAIAAALIGGSVTAATHFSKTGTRALVNASPEPFSNVAVSFAEDALVVGGALLALAYPLVFLVLLVLFLIGAAAVFGWLIAGLRRLFARRGERPPDEPPPAQPPAPPTLGR